MNAMRIEAGDRVRYALLTSPTTHMDYRVTEVTGNGITCAVHAYDGGGRNQFGTVVLDPHQWAELQARDGRAIAPDDTGL